MCEFSVNNYLCKQTFETLVVPVGRGLVDSDCRTNNSVQHLEGERKGKEQKTGREISLVF